MSSSSIFLCVNCSQQYNNSNKKPRTFPCGHVFCEECIKNFENSKIFKCPLDKIFHFNLTIDKIPICVQILDNLPNLENINTNINNKNNDNNDNNNNDISDYINSIGNKISFIKNQINLYNKSEQDILTYFNKQFNKITIFFEKIFIEIKNKKNFFNERISEKLKEQKQKIDKNKKILTNYVIKLNDIIKSYEKIQKSNNFSTFKNMKKNSEKEINDIIKDINNNFITYSQKQIYPFFNEPNMFDIQNRNFFGEIKYTNNLYLNCGNENINNNLNNEFNEINEKNIINFNEEEENIFNKNLFNEKIKKDLNTPNKNDNNNNNNNKYFCPSAKQSIRKIEHYNNINNKSNNIINNNYNINGIEEDSLNNFNEDDKLKRIHTVNVNKKNKPITARLKNKKIYNNNISISKNDIFINNNNFHSGNKNYNNNKIFHEKRSSSLGHSQGKKKNSSKEKENNNNSLKKNICYSKNNNYKNNEINNKNCKLKQKKNVLVKNYINTDIYNNINSNNNNKKKNKLLTENINNINNNNNNRNIILINNKNKILKNDNSQYNKNNNELNGSNFYKNKKNVSSDNKNVKNSKSFKNIEEI